MSASTRLLWTLPLVLSTACIEDEPMLRPTTPAMRGEVVRTETLLVMSRDEVSDFVESVGLTELVTPTHGFTIDRVVYLTPDVDGRLTEASGLVARPDGEGPFPLVSDQHGTQTRRREVLTDPLIESETGLVALFFASEGWMVAGADYLGLGVSDGLHPYYHADTEASATVDLLRATTTLARARDVELSGELFLTGYSQGAHVTMALHRELERAPLPGLDVVASAPMAGAYALADLNVPSALTDPAPSSAFYLTYAILAYDRVYDLYEDPSEVFLPPYDTSVEAMFDGSREVMEIVTALPATPVELLQPAFIRGYLEDQDHPFRAALRDNDLLDWTPQAPITFFHGAADRDVPIEGAVLAEKTLRERGAVVSLVNLGDEVDHGAGSVPAYLGARAWFSALRDAR
jgi:dienelactone hydrolase